MENLKLVPASDEGDVAVLMSSLGLLARQSARELALAPTRAKNMALRLAACAIRARAGEILAANEEDVARAEAQGVAKSFLDRLWLDEKRIDGMARGLDEIATLPDPVGRVTAAFERPNGLVIERVATPLGVLGIIYESRPAVTADAGALCLKSGNVAILRGGSDSFSTSAVIHDCLVEGLRGAGLPETSILRVPVRDRAAVGAMLAGLDGNLDVIVPRGGKSLVARVQEEARVPVFAHLEAVVHIYIHEDADLAKAETVVRNAKLRRTGVCGAVETLLVDRACAATHIEPLVKMLLDAGCEVRGDEEVVPVDARVVPATMEDWRTEYLDSIISVAVVGGIDEAIRHVETFSSHHTDCIITENYGAAERFLNEVDSAIVMHNASTQFADGGEFGFGGEIGIATGRMHARGPIGLEQLMTFKYRVHGSGQTRP